MPPALAASSKPQQEFDYDYERKVMSNDASTSFDTFLAKPEVRAHILGKLCHKVCDWTVLLYVCLPSTSTECKVPSRHVHRASYFQPQASQQMSTVVQACPLTCLADCLL